MNRFFVNALAVSLLTCVACSAQAEEIKIGYVNSDRVLRDAVPAKAAQAKLEAEFSKRDKELSELAGKIKSSSDKLEKEAPSLSESERSRRQRELLDQDREFQRKKREFQKHFSTQQVQYFDSVQ
jgi:outer membrane protein